MLLCRVAQPLYHVVEGCVNTHSDRHVPAKARRASRFVTLSVLVTPRVAQ